METDEKINPVNQNRIQNKQTVNMKIKTKMKHSYMIMWIDIQERKNKSYQRFFVFRVRVDRV